MLSVQLPQGPSTDSYKIYLLVNIIDDTDGSTLYYLSNPVTVQPDNSLANDLASSITSNDANNQLLLNLNSGNLNIVAKNVIAITTIQLPLKLNLLYCCTKLMLLFFKLW